MPTAENTVFVSSMDFIRGLGSEKTGALDSEDKGSGVPYDSGKYESLCFPRAGVSKIGMGAGNVFDAVP